MAKKLLSNIEDMIVHDASSFHAMTPDASSYTIQLGDKDSTFKTTVKVGLPTDISTMLINLTPNLVLKDTSNADIECYSKVQMDASMAALRADVSLYQNQNGLMDAFDPYTVYYENQLVRYNGEYWRCIVTQFQGAWNPAAWRRTTLLDEIKDIRGVQTTVETLTVNVTVNRGTGVVAGTTITVIYDSGTGKPSETATLDATGKATFFMDYGDRYYIEGSGITGYLSPQSTLYVAGIPKRTINLQYKQLGTGVYIIDNNGIEYDVELWDPINNPTARFVKFTNSTLCPGGLSDDNSIIISKNWASQRTSKIWQIEYKDLPSLPNITNASTAELDYNGYRNCQLAYNDCTTPNIAGKTFVDLYNDAQGTSITIAEYLPAIYYAMNVTETFMGKTINGYLPSMGQYR